MFKDWWIYLAQYQVLEKKKSPLYPDLKDGENVENETRRELLAAEEGVSSNQFIWITNCLQGEAKTEEKEEEARKVPVVLAVLAISFGSYIHGTSIVFPDVRNISDQMYYFGFV